jgi:L-rhamnose mutarotase
MITILFSSNYNSKGKKEFKSLFPEVHEWLHAYKKEHGYKNISITLQKMESKLFIDKIYITLKKRGVFCLTKHDSLIIRHNDLGKIMRTLESVCKKSSFSGTFKINYPNKDEVEKIVFNFK